MRTLIALAALALALPAVSSPDADALLDQAQREVRALDRDLDAVRHAGLRAQLEQRTARIDMLLQRVERSGALDRGSGFRGHGPPAQVGLSFQEAMGMVRAESFDRDKLQAIDRAARNGRFTTAQARALVAQLSFDSNRADALIALYPAVVDPHRFVTALDVLDFQSSRRRVANTLHI